MRYSRIVSNNERGFTLLEMLIAAVVAGILATITTPSLLGWLSHSKVNRATSNVRDSLIEAQRQAKRQSKNCSVELGSSIHSQDRCLLSTHHLGEDVQLASNLTQGKIYYKFDGDINEVSTTGETIVLYTQAQDSYKKCLVISEPLAIIREGHYIGSLNEPITQSNCQKN